MMVVSGVVGALALHGAVRRVTGQVLVPSLFQLVVPAPSGSVLPTIILALVAAALLLGMLWLVRMRTSAGG